MHISVPQMAIDYCISLTQQQQENMLTSEIWQNACHLEQSIFQLDWEMFSVQLQLVTQLLNNPLSWQGAADLRVRVHHQSNAAEICQTIFVQTEKLIFSVDKEKMGGDCDRD